MENAFIETAIGLFIGCLIVGIFYIACIYSIKKKWAGKKQTNWPCHTLGSKEITMERIQGVALQINTEVQLNKCLPFGHDSRDVRIMGNEFDISELPLPLIQQPIQFPELRPEVQKAIEGMEITTVRWENPDPNPKITFREYGFNYSDLNLKKWVEPEEKYPATGTQSPPLIDPSNPKKILVNAPSALASPESVERGECLGGIDPPRIFPQLEAGGMDYYGSY